MSDITCSACGAVNAGGYQIETMDGVFCRDCWDNLREHFEAPLRAELAQARKIAEKWIRRADYGFDPEETDVSVAYWRGARDVSREILSCREEPIP